MTVIKTVTEKHMYLHYLRKYYKVPNAFSGAKRTLKII